MKLLANPLPAEVRQLWSFPQGPPGFTEPRCLFGWGQLFPLLPRHQLPYGEVLPRTTG